MTYASLPQLFILRSDINYKFILRYREIIMNKKIKIIITLYIIITWFKSMISSMLLISRALSMIC